VKSIRVQGPFLTDEERAQVVKPGGLSVGMRQATEYEKSILAGLQHKEGVIDLSSRGLPPLHVMVEWYQGTWPHVTYNALGTVIETRGTHPSDVTVARNRRRNKAARRSRRINRLAGAR